MRFVVFGTGLYYQKRKSELKQLCENGEIVLFFDNKESEEEIFEEKRICKPCVLKRDTYDKILLMSRSVVEMREQLISLGYCNSDIWTWKQFICEMSHGNYEFFCGTTRKAVYDKRILIVTTDMGYNGGSIAICCAAKCLSQSNEVIIAAPKADRSFIKEMNQDGINILLCKSLPYLGKEEMYLVESFDVVIVNVFQMLPVAFQICKYKPVLWWIHESGDIYQSVLDEYREFIQEDLFDKMSIFAVSAIPQNIFNSYFQSRIQHTLAYGIPDRYESARLEKKSNKTIFAVIGVVAYGKAQDILVQAIEILKKKNQETKMECWLIGGIPDNDFSRNIIKASQKDNIICIKGKMTRKQIEKAYQNIDVVVCPSREDSLPIAVTEGMMYGKVCIASKSTGTADFIEEKVNGLICETESAESLADAMSWVLEHQEECISIGKEARKTYEAFFNMDRFRNRLEDALNDTINNYEG